MRDIIAKEENKATCELGGGGGGFTCVSSQSLVSSYFLGECSLGGRRGCQMSWFSRRQAKLYLAMFLSSCGRSTRPAYLDGCIIITPVSGTSRPVRDVVTRCINKVNKK